MQYEPPSAVRTGSAKQGEARMLLAFPFSLVVSYTVLSMVSNKAFSGAREATPACYNHRRSRAHYVRALCFAHAELQYRYAAPPTSSAA